MADHAWVNEHLDTYLAGDLTTAERESVEQHVAACEPCKQALADARRLERLMSGLFTDARPAANLDERIIQTLEQQPVRAVQRRPRIWRFFAAAAAMLVVGLVGFIAQAMSESDPLQVAKGNYYFARVPYRSNAFPTGTRGDADRKATNPHVSELEQELKAEHHVTGNSDERAAAKGIVMAKDALDADGLMDEMNKALPGYTQTGTLTPDLKIPALNNTFTLPITGGGGKVAPGMEGRENGRGPGPQKDLPQQRHSNGPNGDPKAVAPNGIAPAQTAGPGDFASYYKNHAYQVNGTARYDKDSLSGSSQRVQFPPMFTSPTMNWTGPSGAMMGTGFGGGMGMTGGGMMGMGGGAGPRPDLTNAPPKQPAVTPKTALYFTQPSDTRTGGNPVRDGSLHKPESEMPSEPKRVTAETTIQPQKAEKKPQQPEPPIETNRKIIRTGDMEFEIDSFDKSVETITRLITAIKGGFVATINSDKLANGKMRGSIVVRMPPQHLDQFILELRRELAKTGELKNQRIISLDVTKQYTDIESRLRAARAIEERLINIIKTGKGEIKDLVAAEKEMGIWRIKIEEMEGEIRYYANQVALSTLTITLHEKEILAPSAIVITDSVRMRLEVEDVARAQQIAMAAVEEVKGRITKSELKQHSAGQLQSILFAEIPPAKKDAFRDKLKKLGILSDHTENQQQHTEGGVGRGPGLKPQLDDVRFEVTMHNTANVRPRLTADLKLATSDVPASYARLLDEIAKLRGQVRDGKLNEQDKLNITAFLDFNVPTAEKPALDKVLLDLGPVLERVNVLAPVNELSTAQKYGYTLHLRDFASIAPSKSITEIVAVTDVAGDFGRLQEAVAKAKGQVIQANLNEADKNNIFAQFDFTVLSEEKPGIDKLVAELGTSLSKTKFQTPMNQLSTPRKFGYSLHLRDFVSVPPTKATELKIATSDVPTIYAKLQEAILKVRGRISDGKLNEQDKLHITAQIAFTVPSEERAGIDKLLGELGAILSRNNVQAPVNQLSTAKKFGYSLDLRDFATIPPSEASVLTIAASKVPDHYAKLMDAILKAKGQVRDGKLNEQDKLNVTGQIDFTVPSGQKPAIEKLLAEMGTMLSRKNEQVPVNVLSTDGKFGYSVVLRDFANIQARETFVVQVALDNVPASFRDFQEAVKVAKGWVKVGQLVEDNKAKIGAQIDFDVPTEKKQVIEDLLAKNGAVLSRTSTQVAADNLATDQKVGYRLSLFSTGSIPPREKTLIKFDVADVDAKSTEFKQIILAGKGKVIDSSIDRFENGQTAAVLVFEVPFASQETLIRQMGKPISQRTARNAQIPENPLTTAQIIVTLAGGSPIVPDDKGIGTYVRTSLNLSFQILATIVMTLIVGLSAILPCVIILLLGFKLYVLMFGVSKPAPVVVAGPAASEEKLSEPPA